MSKNVYHFCASRYRIGGSRVRKPHTISIHVSNTWIEMKFSSRDYDLMWEIYKVVDKEMELNLKYSNELRNMKEVSKQ